MTAFLTLDRDYTATDFARETHAFLVSLDPAVWREEASMLASEKVLEIHASAKPLLEAWDDMPPRGDAEVRIRDAAQTLWDNLPDPARMTRIEWPHVRKELEPLYEKLADVLRKEGETVERLHPTNYMRNLLHVGSGVGVAIAYATVMTPRSAILIALAFAIWAWTLEGSRRFLPWWNDIIMWAFGSFARPHEFHRVNSGTWFGSALLVLTITAPGWPGLMGVLALSVGDPTASVFGRRFGRTRIMGGSRSLEGAIAFAVMTSLVGMAFLTLFYTAIPLGIAILISVTTGIIGAVTEALTGRFEDNLTIPLVVGWSMLGLQAIMGV